MKTLVVVNPHASHGEARREFETKIKALLDKKLGRYDLHITTGQGDAINFVAEHPDYDRVVSVGGDGNLNEVVNGLMLGASRASLGVVAVGSGNDFVKSINLGQEYDRLVEAACGDSLKEVDLFKVKFTDFSGNRTERYSVNVVSAGFDADVTQRMIRSRFKTSGKVAYYLSFLIEFFKSKTYELSYRIDGQNGAGKYYFLVMANGKYYGGGMKIAPDAVIDDGVIDIVGVAKMSKLKLLFNSTKIYRGTHLEIEGVEHYIGKDIYLNSERETLIQMDGEVVGVLPLEISVHRKALKVASA